MENIYSYQCLTTRRNKIISSIAFITLQIELCEVFPEVHNRCTQTFAHYTVNPVLTNLLAFMHTILCGIKQPNVLLSNFCRKNGTILRHRICIKHMQNSLTSIYCLNVAEKKQFCLQYLLRLCE